MKIGIGLIGCDRPALFERAKASLAGVTYRGESINLYEEIDYERTGVGKTKNRLLQRMMIDENDWLIVMEDDIEVTDSSVVERYIDAAIASGYPHLLFAHHGGRNRLHSGETNLLRYWPNCVGAWCIYAAEAIDWVGYIDENFPANHLEHVEHSARILSTYGLRTHPYWPDLKDSHFYLREQPEGLTHRSITTKPETWEAAVAYWQQSHPETSLWSPY